MFITVVVAFLVALLMGLLYKWGELGGAPGRQNDLFVAIWRNETNKVAKLLAEGADPNGPSNKANRPTPLIDAVSFGRLEITRLLLSGGADPNRVDRAGCGALYHALDSSYLGGPNDTMSAEIVGMLIEHGADLSAAGITNAIRNLPRDDPRVEICLKAFADRVRRTNAARRTAH